MTCGHPDKACDQVADAVLDAILREDADALVGCEVTASLNKVHIMGEITTSCTPDYERIARETLCSIGYTSVRSGLDARACEVTVDVHQQSPEITRSVERVSTADAGAGDQGVVFGYACDETDCFMPLPITLAHNLVHRLDDIRRSRTIDHLQPDGKSQVSLEYHDGTPYRIAAVIMSSQYDASLDIDTVRDEIIERIIKPVLPTNLVDEGTLLYVNPTGHFSLGGPAANTGLSGRKTIVDTYGSTAHSGGSSLAGKDPSKINRCGAYLARYVAKNIVAAGLARRCECALAYAIGLTDPVCMNIDTFGTGKVADETLAAWVEKSIDLRPAMIIRRFNLRRPIYHALSCYGHVGENAREMPWEQTDLTTQLLTEFG